MRPISGMLALVLAALLALSIPCLAENASFGAFTVDQYTSFAVVGNALYAADTLNDSLWRYDNAGGSSSYETGRDTEIIALASCDGRLYSLESRMIPKPEQMRADYEGSFIYELVSDGEDVLLSELQLPESLDSSDAPYRLETALCDGERMYLLFPTNESTQTVDFSASPMTLVILEMASGEYDTVAFENASQLIALNGNLLMYSRNAEGETEIVIRDMTSEEEHTLLAIAEEEDGAYRPEGFTLDFDGQILYYAIAGDVFAHSIADGSVEKVGNAGADAGVTLARLDDGTLFACNSSSVGRILNTNSEIASSQSLTVSNGGDLVNAFAVQHPEIAVQGTYMEEDALIDAILTQSPFPDVIYLITYREAAYRSLRDRGYLSPIDDAEAGQFVAQLHPDIVDAITVNGAICAVPVHLYPASMYGVNLELWESHSLGELPQTWLELAQLFGKWPEISRENPDLTLFSTEDLEGMGYASADGLRTLLLAGIVNKYEYYRQDQAEFMGYDTTLFREMMAAYEAIDFDALYESIVSGGESALLTPSYRADLLTWDFNDAAFSPLKLTMNQGEDYQMPAGVEVIVVNPYSENKESAMEYLHFVIEQIDDVERAKMIPALNDPLRPDGYEEQVAAMQEEIDFLTEQAANGEGGAQAAAEAQLAQAQADLERYQEDGWLIPEHALSEYRALSESMFIEYATELNQQEQENVYELRVRYMSGELPLDQFIQQLDRRVTMRDRED